MMTTRPSPPAPFSAAPPPRPLVDLASLPPPAYNLTTGLPATEYGESDAQAVTQWLTQRGLGKFAPVFHLHEVDMVSLPNLTLEDLRDMKIYTIGSRRRILMAIDEMHH